MRPHGCSPPGCSVLGILQARIVEWVAIPFSRPDPGIKLESPALQVDSLPSKPHILAWCQQIRCSFFFSVILCGSVHNVLLITTVALFSVCPLGESCLSQRSQANANKFSCCSVTKWCPFATPWAGVPVPHYPGVSPSSGPLSW